MYTPTVALLKKDTMFVLGSITHNSRSSFESQYNYSREALLQPSLITSIHAKHRLLHRVISAIGSIENNEAQEAPAVADRDAGNGCRERSSCGVDSALPTNVVVLRIFVVQVKEERGRVGKCCSIVCREMP